MELTILKNRKYPDDIIKLSEIYIIGNNTIKICWIYKGMEFFTDVEGYKAIKKYGSRKIICTEEFVDYARFKVIN